MTHRVATLSVALLALGAGGAAAQTVKPIVLNDFVSCTAQKLPTDDPGGLLVYGSNQYQYLYAGDNLQTTNPSYALFPASTAGATWNWCQYGGDAINSVATNRGQGLYLSDLSSGDVVGGEFASYSGSIQKLVLGGNSDGSDQMTVLHSFKFPASYHAGPQTPDGDTPTGLVRSTAGALYGGTAEGGPTYGGTVYRLTPPTGGSTTWTELVLHAFGGSQGGTPVVWIVAPDGAIYGTTEPASDGTVAASVWRLAPVGQSWVFSTLHRFSATPTSPLSPLVRGPDGSVYGTVGATGYTYDNNILRHGGKQVFRLTPPAAGGSSWAYKNLFSFPVAANTASNLSFVASDGTIYGFTGYYGSPCSGGSCGRIWQLTPPPPTGSAYTARTLYDYLEDPTKPGVPPVDFVQLGFRHQPDGVGLIALAPSQGGGDPDFLLQIKERGWQ